MRARHRFSSPWRARGGARGLWESAAFAVLLVAWALGERAWWGTTPWALVAVAVVIVLVAPRDSFAPAVLLMGIGAVLLFVTGGTHISWPGRMAVGLSVFLFSRRMGPWPAAAVTAGALFGQALWYVAVAPAGLSDTASANFSLALAVPQVAAAVVGQLVVQRRLLHEAVLARTEEAHRAERLAAEKAARDEQDRLAREMHDVIGHRVGNIVMLARVLEEYPEAREDVVRDAALIEKEGRTALEELRAVFRGMAGRVPAPPVHGLEDLRELVSDTGRALGREIALDVDGFPEVLALPVQHAVRRAVQEGLANAAKHAPGAAVGITLVCARDGVHLTIANGPPGEGARPRAVPMVGAREEGVRSEGGRAEEPLPAGGLGLAGTRARVAALGGTLTTREDPDGGFVLAIRIPRHGDPTAVS
ncbi:histidine kinase [Streptomyces sp. NPDC097619]|uniref:sensor histidine kinase n=1 Tax=Streptomyces sp. NPDC097619 TaxID=3157228 RepID=UPI0033205525